MNFPVLDAWLSNASVEVVWKRLMSLTNTRPDAILESLERIVAVIEEIEPHRLQSKKKDFRSDKLESNQINLRFELLTAAHCILSGYSIDFGGAKQEDILVHIPSRAVPLGIECGSRTKRDIWLLHDELEARLSGFNGRVLLSFSEKVLHIPNHIRATATNRIIKEIDSGVTDMHSLLIPEIPVRVIFYLNEQEEHKNISGMKVSISTGAELWRITEFMLKEIETTIEDKIRQSDLQGRQTDSILLVHIARVDEAFLRSTSAWKQDLQQLVLKYPDLPFSAIGFSLNDLTSEDLKMIYVLNPRIDGTTALHVEELLEKIVSRESFE